MSRDSPAATRLRPKDKKLSCGILHSRFLPMRSRVSTQSSISLERVSSDDGARQRKRKSATAGPIGTRNLAQSLSQAKIKPKVFVCSSAIGYYGDRGEEVLKEDSAPGQGFLPDVCREWEAATRIASDAGIRTVQIRTGIVLSPKGGALGSMLTPFKLGVGGKIGSGKQWMSWIDVQDMAGGILHVMITIPCAAPSTWLHLLRLRTRNLRRPWQAYCIVQRFFRFRAIVVKTLFGEMGETVLLGSQRVQPGQLLASRYPFQLRTLRESLETIASQPNPRVTGPCDPNHRTLNLRAVRLKSSDRHGMTNRIIAALMLASLLWGSAPLALAAFRATSRLKSAATSPQEIILAVPPHIGKRPSSSP